MSLLLGKTLPGETYSWRSVVQCDAHCNSRVDTGEQVLLFEGVVSAAAAGSAASFSDAVRCRILREQQQQQQTV